MTWSNRLNAARACLRSGQCGSARALSLELFNDPSAPLEIEFSALLLYVAALDRLGLNRLATAKFSEGMKLIDRRAKLIEDGASLDGVDDAATDSGAQWTARHPRFDMPIEQRFAQCSRAHQRPDRHARSGGMDSLFVLGLVVVGFVAGIRTVFELRDSTPMRARSHPRCMRRTQHQMV